MIASAPASFPHLRLRAPTPALLALPWELPLADWPDSLPFRRIPVGPSRHLVRFLDVEGTTYALKELPLPIASREFEVLTHLERLELPAVAPTGIAESPGGEAILVTEYLRHSLQYRRLFMRLPLVGGYRDRLLDAMAGLLVELHRNGVYWGDCSLANTLFRRDGDRIQAYLVDAETSETHPSLSDGQRAWDLEILVENVAFGLADLAAMQGRTDEIDESIAIAEGVGTRYRALWRELTEETEVAADDRYAMSARVRRLNELGFSVDELELVPSGDGRVRLRVAVTTRRFHARELLGRTGIHALEGQARLLLNDLREYRAWIERHEGIALSRTDAARRWLAEVFLPTLERIEGAIGPHRDRVQAYCDVLETKWIRSERARRDVGLAAAIDSYLEQGAPAPEGSDAGIPSEETGVIYLDELDERGLGS
ncbi:MAG: hypothetical protein RL338_833 [Chloroflexota bacterium]